MIIEVDEYKKKVPNYDPEQSELFHRESARLADKDFIEQLRTGKYSEVIFMAGGAASGKTEFCVSYLMNDHQLIYDGTLKNFDGFKIKLSNINRYAKNSPKSKVVLIIPDVEIFTSQLVENELRLSYDRLIIKNRNNTAGELIQIARDLYQEVINRKLEISINYDIFR